MDENTEMILDLFIMSFAFNFQEIDEYTFTLMKTQRIFKAIKECFPIDEHCIQLHNTVYPPSQSFNLIFKWN